MVWDSCTQRGLAHILKQQCMRCCSNLLDGSAVIFTAFNQSNLRWHPKASKTTVGILWKVSLNILHAANASAVCNHSAALLLHEVSECCSLLPSGGHLRNDRLPSPEVQTSVNSKMLKKSIFICFRTVLLLLVKYNITRSHTEALERLPEQHYTTAWFIWGWVVKTC